MLVIDWVPFFASLNAYIQVVHNNYLFYVLIYFVVKVLFIALAFQLFSCISFLIMSRHLLTITSI
jgi:hypothetical protein